VNVYNARGEKKREQWVGGRKDEQKPMPEYQKPVEQLVLNE
jgi:hypothetical protein